MVGLARHFADLNSIDNFLELFQYFDVLDLIFEVLYATRFDGLAFAVFWGGAAEFLYTGHGARVLFAYLQVLHVNDLLKYCLLLFPPFVRPSFNSIFIIFFIFLLSFPFPFFWLLFLRRLLYKIHNRYLGRVSTALPCLPGTESANPFSQRYFRDILCLLRRPAKTTGLTDSSVVHGNGRNRQRIAFLMAWLWLVYPRIRLSTVLLQLTWLHHTQIILNYEMIFNW